MLSTILAHEQVALARSQEAAAAYALAERDDRTGLLNHRGWQAALRREDQRLERYGSHAGVLAATIERPGHVDDTDADPKGEDLRERCAQVLADTSRPGDVQAQFAADEFAVLAIECDARCLKALEVKLRIDLRTAGVTVSTGAAARRVGEHLSATSDRARATMATERRRRQVRGA